MSDLRARVLDDRQHGQGLWRSDWTGVLYRHHEHSWQMFFEGRWQQCVNESSSARYHLYGTNGETFVRVGEVL
ncbi:hypothetical protein SEA_BIGSWOLE_155 [Mycobacterium phage Bigswole]|uniref:Uncharacterized protein n=1 Tax=Mycobacterium phage Bigswole TaxID=2041521 RepID=A0A2D1G857_9CAUD|nr:hypothetical protein KHO58_gp175 [Mycobacterium phage Bigswole]ATN87824.1 hypothetical protein SEA_BIGSWOLE_155 [Mycobacterium phage Bigswole]